MILLIASTGYTGRLVAKQLARLGASVRLAGRDLERVQELNSELGQNFDCVRVDVKDAATLHEAMDGCKVVINCAGPFTVLGEPVVNAAIRAGAHYLDTTGEQPFIKQAFDKYGSAARESGCALIPACAFEYAIGDAASELMDKAKSDDSLWDDIEVRYSFKGVGTSRGTQKSVLKVLGLPAFSLKDEKLSAIDSSKGDRNSIVDSRINRVLLENIDSKDFRSVYRRFNRKAAFAFPGGEVLLVPLHMKVRNLTTLITSDLPGPMLGLVGNTSRWLGRSALAGLVEKVIDRGADGPSEASRENTSFNVRVLGVSAQRPYAVMATGKDPYLLTAVIVAEIANRLDHGVSQCVGPTSPSMVAGADFIKTCTEAFGVKWCQVTSGE